MVTLRLMRYFDALATTLHFGKAAGMVSVSQPALSAQIAEMERLLDVRLVERQRSGAILTREGEELLPEIRDILERVERLAERVKPRQGPFGGRLRIGIIPTVAPYLVPRLIPELRHRSPALGIELKELLTAGCLEELKQGRLDCAVLALPVRAEGIDSLFLFEDRFLIASAEDERTGVIWLPLVVWCLPSWNIWSRATCGL